MTEVLIQSSHEYGGEYWNIVPMVPKLLETCQHNIFFHTNLEGVCWYFLTFTEKDPQVYGYTIVAHFTHKYLGYHIFSRNGSVEVS
jgi:hypothetical protein